jgi:copper(I)-binding protein
MLAGHFGKRVQIVGPTLDDQQGTFMTLKPLRLIFALALGLQAVSMARAQTTVADPWIRATVTQQATTGMFARITSAEGGRLVSASSPVAGVVEIHEMAMEGSVMKMRAIGEGLELPAGKTVELKPGGYHVMLMDLKQQLKEGETVPITFVVEGKDGRRENVEVKAPVKALTAQAAPMSQPKR